MAANVSEKKATLIPLSPYAMREFERFFLDWLDQNQEALEAGGKGNLEYLAMRCARWAAAYLPAQEPSE